MSNIMYIPSLNASTTLSQQGHYYGFITTAPTDNNCTAITNGATTIVDLEYAFKIYTTPDAGNINVTTADLTNWTAKPKLSVATLFENGDVGNGNSGNIGIHQAMKKLALAVFGSENATDFFSNSNDLISSYVDAFVELNQIVNANTTVTATQNIGNALFYHYPQRFTLQYNAIVVGGAGTIGTHTNKAVLRNGSDTGAKVTVVLDLVNRVTTISVTTVTSNLQVTAGDSITITAGGGSANVTISTINAIQAAMLNGTLSNASGTSLPFEVGDTFRVQYLINPHLSQINGSGELINANIGKYQAFMDFVTVA